MLERMAEYVVTLMMLKGLLATKDPKRGYNRVLVLIGNVSGQGGEPEEWYLGQRNVLQCEAWRPVVP